MGRLRKLSRLSAQDWVILGQTWALLLLLEIALHLLSFRTILNLGGRWSRGRQSPAEGATVSVERYVWLTGIVGRYAAGRSTCLKQALVLSFLLQRRGVRTTLRIGVSRATGRFKAHAWLEEGGRIIFGFQEEEAYEPLLP